MKLNMVDSNGYYSLGHMLSRAEVVSALVGKYGNSSKSLAIDDAEKLISENLVKANGQNKEQVFFIEAGISFHFVDNQIDASLLPEGSVDALEQIKDAKYPWYPDAKELIVRAMEPLVAGGYGK